jgi:hypothetical protein
VLKARFRIPQHLCLVVVVPTPWRLARPASSPATAILPPRAANFGFNNCQSSSQHIPPTGTVAEEGSTPSVPNFAPKAGRPPPPHHHGATPGGARCTTMALLRHRGREAQRQAATSHVARRWELSPLPEAAPSRPAPPSPHNADPTVGGVESGQGTPRLVPPRPALPQ